ncbi:probable G-protein coupled receptor CG31760 [Phlebotomus argentipes]|uniref:probable G-protein coupled receptor CG31760 n=1 Tax=Phlebotomus argentipes TaxID=94469 RepID=UPI002892C0C8|nr:probable G-protein coupled receptor CG31760 [Phlebotomus argentipes]
MREHPLWLWCGLILRLSIFIGHCWATSGPNGILATFSTPVDIGKDAIEESLQTIHDIATENLGKYCLSRAFRPLRIPLRVERYEGARQKADLAATVLQDVGVNRHGGLLDAIAKGLLGDTHVTAARILALNITNGAIITAVWWSQQLGGLGGPHRVEEDGVSVGLKPDMNYPWFEDEMSSPGLRSPKFSPSPISISFKGWWTYPYYLCSHRRWTLSYSVAIPPTSRHGIRGFLSVDVDVSELHVNQCNSQPDDVENSLEIDALLGSHKCHPVSMECDHRFYAGGRSKGVHGNGEGWRRGDYQCLCRPGFYSSRHPLGFNGSVMEVAYQEFWNNESTIYMDKFQCLKCADGCGNCMGPAPCLATYNWVFRITLLTVSVLCAVFTISLAFYMYRHRKVKVFKVASPIFLTITLLGCSFMYLEMAAIFPILDTCSCIATKWTRHMGFCITYTSLLMKTWRVSLTYRVKSAHKVKLTDKQLLQWMVPILLVMLIYLGTWTLSAPPIAEEITDKYGLKFKQCSYNWWDHSLAIGEVLFLAWGIRVCYNVRHAESMYNEARLISYAIYNIALVNTTMVAFHLFIFPQAGPDIKYLLGFIRTQLSTSVTVALVFGPKVVRVLRGQGDQWDNKARVRGVTASFSLNGIGLVPEDTPDLYQENEELKEEVQKLAAQIEFMKIVNMEMNNRHLKPKPGGYFTLTSSLQSPLCKASSSQSQSIKQMTSQVNNATISDDGHSGSNSVGTNSIGYPAAPSHTTSGQLNSSERV